MDLNEVIRYGSYISLDSDQGLLTTSGFLNEQLYFSNSFPQKSIFRILPQSICTIQEALLQSTQQDDFTDKYNRMKGILEGEITLNISTSISYHNQPVTFGSVVQLQHIFSKKFLTISLQKHDEHRDKQKVILSNFSNENSSFYIQSAFKYQEEGTAFIKSGAKIVIRAALKDFERFVYLDVLDDLNEIAGNVDNKLAFTIKSYSIDQSKGLYLACGDYIQLIHSEENFCLIGMKNQYEKSIIEPKFSQNHLNCNSIWVLENIENTKGGLLYTDNWYTIKNIACDLYLGIEIDDDRVPRICLTAYSSEAKWRITQNSSEEIVISEKFYRLVHDESELTLGAENSENLGNNEQYTPTLTVDNSNVSYFKLKKCTEYFSGSTIFLISCQEFLNHFFEQTKSMLENKSADPILLIKQINVLKECLTSIELFCKNKLEKLISVEIPFGEIDVSKQNALRDLKIISSLTDILHIFSMHKYFNAINSNQQSNLTEEITTVVSSIFQLITVICENNIENQLEAFSNISTYLRFIDKDQEANRFLISLVKNNENLLFKMQSFNSGGNQEIILYFINALKVKYM